MNPSKLLRHQNAYEHPPDTSTCVGLSLPSVCQYFPIPEPDPIDALLFRMEQEGIDRKELARLLGASSGRTSEILSGQRPLSITMIRTLHRTLGIPGDILIRESKKRPVKPRAATRPRTRTLAR